MGWDISTVKNPHLRDQLLKRKAEALHSKKEAVANPSQIADVQLGASLPSSVDIKSSTSTEIFFTVRGPAIGKPRMTRVDKWKKRPRVLRYRDYADRIRAAAGTIPQNPLGIHVRVFIPVSASWSKTKKNNSLNKLHRLKPDVDNLTKSVLDSLFSEDSCVAASIAEKYWCTEAEERTEIRVIYDESVLSRYGIGFNTCGRHSGVAENSV